MSDLAPFVASVLRDRTMVEMIAEMEKLKRLVEDRLKVQITGRKGSPVYFEGSLKNGYTSHRGRCFEVMFDDHDDQDTPTSTTKNPSHGRVLKLKAFSDIEIRLGGIIIQRLDFQNVMGSCNAPFFTNDDFYRDTKYNKPIFLAPERKEIVLKVKNRHKGPVPFVLARFGKEMSLKTYRKLHQLNMSDLKVLADSRIGYTLILDGLTFSKQDIKKSLSILNDLGYSVDKGNSHYRHSTSDDIDQTKLTTQKKGEADRFVSTANAVQ
uniref:Uncharacterized protein n=1 Tax=Pseudo-nitzschia arenysensis TaxID=697910 RepID=A0A7R9ZU92_9STRA|mmetsp:Transcript_726/g.1735  ORF Transcript_726/g.1735 Transcript_726/m.1735 type:complete len:266 (+) Transcript_726:122-919(+)